MNYVLNDEKMFADVTDGVAIIINSETGIYYGLNGLGTAVYENLVNGVSTDKILNCLKSMSDCPSDIEEKLTNFLKAMVDFDLIKEGGDDTSDAEIDENVAKESSFEMDVREYNDAQELLLADPIHEVKEESGWTPETDSIGYTKEETSEREEKLED